MDGRAAGAPDLVLRYADAEGRLAGVRLIADLLKREPPRAFARNRSGDGWELALPTPPVDRIEYQLELEHASGRREVVCDPDAPRAPGPFGEKSVLELPGYAPPAWLDGRPAPPGRVEPLELPSRRLRAEVRGLLWAPADSDPAVALPLLVVHDGPEFAAYSGLVRMLDAASAAREVPPFRAALLAPVHGERNEHYAASARYAAALELELLPAIAERSPSPPGSRQRVGMGASLGALAMLHAHRTRPGTFGGLFLQSGSFRHRTDRHEHGFPRFDRIARFVGTVLRADRWPEPIPVGMTCGGTEENAANNRAVAAALGVQGYPVTLTEVRDLHNWVAWRDTLEPGLVDLLGGVWG